MKSTVCAVLAVCSAMMVWTSVPNDAEASSITTSTFCPPSKGNLNVPNVYMTAHHGHFSDGSGIFEKLYVNFNGLAFTDKRLINVWETIHRIPIYKRTTYELRNGENDLVIGYSTFERAQVMIEAWFDNNYCFFTIDFHGGY